MITLGVTKLVIFLILTFLLHLIFGILLKNQTSSLLFTCSFISMWAHAFFLYSMDYNPLLNPFVLLLKLSLMWPVGTRSG